MQTRALWRLVMARCCEDQFYGSSLPLIKPDRSWHPQDRGTNTESPRASLVCVCVHCMRAHDGKGQEHRTTTTNTANARQSPGQGRTAGCGCIPPVGDAGEQQEVTATVPGESGPVTANPNGPDKVWGSLHAWHCSADTT